MIRSLLFTLELFSSSIYDNKTKINKYKHKYKHKYKYKYKHKYKYKFK